MIPIDQTDNTDLEKILDRQTVDHEDMLKAGLEFGFNYARDLSVYRDDSALYAMRRTYDGMRLYLYIER